MTKGAPRLAGLLLLSLLLLGMAVWGVPALLYQSGRLDNSVPFAELQRRSHINARAQAADKAEDFSQRIRGTAALAAH